MFEQNIETAIEAAREYVVEHDRSQYLKQYDIIKDYCKEMSLILGGSAAVSVIREEDISDDFSITIWTDTDAKIHAEEIAKRIYTTKTEEPAYIGAPHKGTPFAGYKRNIDGSYTILNGVTMLGRIYYNDKVYKSGLTKTVDGLIIAHPWILYATHLQRTFSPTAPKKDLDLERELYKFCIEDRKRRHTDGHDYVSKANKLVPFEKLIRILDDAEHPYAFIGEKAIQFISGGDAFETGRAQILYEGPIGSFDKVLKNAFPGKKIFFNQRPLQFPSDPILKKYTFFIEGKALVDIFNTPFYNAIPIVPIDRGGEIAESGHQWTHIASVHVLIYFRIVDLWTIMAEGLDHAAESITANIEYLREQLFDERDGDKKHFLQSKYLFPIDQKKYIGHCTNPMHFVKKVREEFVYLLEADEQADKKK